MALRIQTSTSLQLINRGVSRAQSDLRVSLRRLATGLRINGASDDAAGLAISERLNARVRGALMTIQNLNMGASAVQVIEGALDQSERALMRMRELSVAAASETLNAQDRDALNAEFKLLSAHLDAIAEQTHYNGIRLLDGQHQQLKLQVGGERGDTFQVKLAHVSACELGRQARYTTQRRGVFAGPAETGDLKLNGVAIRGTEPTDDDISYSFSSGSSIAKAAAINDATQFTGVRAIVEHNSFTGFEPIRAVDHSPQRFFKPSSPDTPVSAASSASAATHLQRDASGLKRSAVFSALLFVVTIVTTCSCLVGPRRRSAPRGPSPSPVVVAA